MFRIYFSHKEYIHNRKIFSLKIYFALYLSSEKKRVFFATDRNRFTLIISSRIYTLIGNNKILSPLSSTRYLFIYLFLHLFNLFTYLFLATVGLHCCMQAFSSCDKRGLLFSCSARAPYCCGFSLSRDTGSRCVGFSSCGMQAQ